MCYKTQINFNFLNRDLGDISRWSKFLTKNIQFLKWKSTKISNAEISWSRNIVNPVSFISNTRSKILMGTTDIWISANCTQTKNSMWAHVAHLLNWPQNCGISFAPSCQKWPCMCLMCAHTVKIFRQSREHIWKSNNAQYEITVIRSRKVITMGEKMSRFTSQLFDLHH